MLDEETKDAIAYALQFTKMTDEEVKSFKEMMKDAEDQYE